MSEKKKYYCEMAVNLGPGPIGFGTTVFLNGAKVPHIGGIEIKITPAGVHEVYLKFTPDNLIVRNQPAESVVADD